MSATIPRLMIVEDNRGDAILLKRALERAASTADIQVMDSAEKAWDALLEAVAVAGPLPHLMVVDINLPGINGLEFIRRCKADDRLRHMPAIVLSSSDSPNEIYFAYQHCAAGYIRKPITSGQYDHIARCLTSCWLDLMELPEAVPSPRLVDI